MKRLFIIIFLGTISQFVFGQKKIGEVKWNSPYPPLQLQINAFKDTLYLNYDDFGYEVYDAKIVFPDGSSINSPLKDLSKAAICGIFGKGSFKTVYFIEEGRKRTFVKSAIFNSKYFKVNIINVDTINGNYIGSEVLDERLIVYSFQKKTKELRISEVVEQKVKKEILLKLPIDISKFKENEIAFLRENEFIRPEQALANVKIISSKDSLKIVVDDAFREFADEVKDPKTLSMIIDKKSGAIETHVFKESNKYFSSFIVDKYLFRYIPNTDFFDLQVFDLSTGIRILFQRFFSDKSLDKVVGVTRQGRENLISYYDGIGGFKNFDPPFTHVNRNSKGDYIIVLGEYFNLKDAQFGLGNSVASTIFSTIYTQATRKPGAPEVSDYFYLKGTTSNKFDYVRSKEELVETINQKIDNYEVNSLEKYSFKDYFDFGDHVIAVYKYLGSLEGNKLHFIRFDK
jgi:hypothetical protein